MRAKNYILTILFFFFLPVFNAGADIDKDLELLKPGQWYEIPNSSLKESNVIPNPSPPGNSGAQAVISAWSSGAYDSKRKQLVIWGGGHEDYAGNEIYAFDLKSYSWKRLWGPTPNKDIPLEYKAYQTYRDGNPSSRHTYAGLQYIPEIDALWNHGATMWRSGVSGNLPFIATWLFDFSTHKWEQRGFLSKFHSSKVSAYDPKTGHIYSRSVTGIHEYDPQTGKWIERYKFPAGWWYLANAAIDPINRKMLMIGKGAFDIFDLETYQLKTIKAENISGDREIIMATAPGLEYYPKIQKFVAWSGESEKGIPPDGVYVIDIGRQVIEKRYSTQTYKADVPLKSTRWGTYGRFRYIPDKDLFIVVNSIARNVYAYRLSEISTPPKNYHGTEAMGKLKLSPTRFSIGIEWHIDSQHLNSDGNHNATTEVYYRPVGNLDWKRAHSLMRIHEFDYNMMAGSILFLDPETMYEIELRYFDPDGGKWHERKTVKTIRIPAKPKGGRVLHVVPGSGGGNGSKSDPFKGFGIAIQNARPGDTYLIHPGIYTGVKTFNRAGNIENYIVWQAVEKGQAVLKNKIKVSASYNWFEGLAFDIGIDCKGIQSTGDSLNNSPHGIVIKGNLFECSKACGTNFYMIHGVPHARDWYITDNIIKGPLPVGLKSFGGEGIDMGYHNPNDTGHTISYNRISNVADGISYTGGNCDIFGNDIFDVTDDGIEPDYASANVRIYNNRISMAQNNAISLQDVENGMPWFIIRNQIIGYTESVLKTRQLENRFAFYHNTVVTWKDIFRFQPHFVINGRLKNNIFVSMQGGRMWNFERLSTSYKTAIDYNAFDWGDFTKPFRYKIKNYSDIEHFASASGLDRNSIRVNWQSCFKSSDFLTPGLQTIPEQFLYLKKGCAVIDRGIILPNINDGYLGKAPDMGAYEFGAALPHYGPRND